MVARIDRRVGETPPGDEQLIAWVHREAHPLLIALQDRINAAAAVVPDPVEIDTDDATQTVAERISMADGECLTIRVEAKGRAGKAWVHQLWERVFAREAATITIVHTEANSGPQYFGSLSSASVALTADPDNDQVTVDVTGEAITDIHWTLHTTVLRGRI